MRDSKYERTTSLEIYDYRKMKCGFLLVWIFALSVVFAQGKKMREIVFVVYLVWWTPRLAENCVMPKWIVRIVCRLQRMCMVSLYTNSSRPISVSSLRTW